MTRGDVYELRVRRGAGHEHSGRRYGVVVQADELAALSTVLIAPTSTRARAASCRPEIDVRGTRARVLVEQTGAVDASRLGRTVAHVTHEERWVIDDALLLILGLT